MSNPKVAVIMPVFNEQDRIIAAINSVLNQTFKDWVLIIINDGSTDNTSDVLKEYIFNPKVIIEHLSINGGVANARNIGLNIAASLNVEYIAWLDSDDTYLEDKLEWQFKFMEENKEMALLSCSLAVLAKGKLISVMQPFPRMKRLEFNRVDEYDLIPSASALIRLSEIGSTRFNEELKYGSDQDFLRRLLINKKYVFFPEIGYLYNRGYSFSTLKYKETLILDRLAKKSIGVSNYILYKEWLKNVVKNSIVLTLFKFDLLDLYFSMMGRKPYKSERVLVERGL